MNRIAGVMRLLTTATVLLFSVTTGHAQLTSGQAAPLFSLKDMNGRTFDLAAKKDKQLTILYFFDVNSRPSQEGLFSLNQLARQYAADLSVSAITTSPRDKVAQFGSSTGLLFPLILDTGNVSTLYHAKLVLPVVCIIGPGLKVLDYFQGGGKTTEAMLVRLAERQLQRKMTKVAKAISTELVKKNPRNVKAKAVIGYAAMKGAELNEAETVFREIERQGADGDVIGKEGLADVYAKRNQHDKALKLLSEVERKAPDRSYAHVIKGNILYAQNRKKEAEVEYRSAVTKKSAEPYQDAVRYNQLGRYYANTGKSGDAKEWYDKAVTIDPYYVEGTTNKGLVLEKEGKWDQALKTYQQALSVDKNDMYAAVLARRAQEMLDLQKDTDRSKRMDLLVKELTARFKSQKGEKPPEDTWTSRPMVLTFYDFEEKGGLAERGGFSSVFISELTSRLNASGRVTVVERALMERLLTELNLGSSELANPDTSLKLGKILAAKLIGTGSLFSLPDGSMLTFRLIDTETSDIPQLTTNPLEADFAIDKEILRMNRDILKTVMTKYPLQGYVMKVAGDETVINIGARQGVVSGTRFKVIEESEMTEYKGRKLRSLPKVVGQVEVARVEPDLAYVKSVSLQRPLKADDKIQEWLDETPAAPRQAQ